MMNSMELEALAAAAARRRKIEQESLKKQQKQEELEVTGVSRSGRVRKKSSKLMDFESPDDIDTRARRLPPNQGTSTPRPPSAFRPDQSYADNEEDSDSDGYDNNDHNEREYNAGQGSSMEWDSSSSEPEPSRSTPAAHTPAHHSLYMMEKAKKKAVKDSRTAGVKTKATRKDKGQRKSRITAYMLWARGARHELIQNCPDMDFSAISKRLGEMWANVNFNERHMWKRKAKRYALKQEELQQQQQPANKIISNLGNAAPARQWTPTPTQRQVVQRTPVKPQVSPVINQQQANATVGAGVYRVTGCGAADVAAHLRLLGESLAIIGERLKEHEGQIAVSGSVSVLLDTLLCSLAPLMCVTRAIPSIAPPATLLQDTLDNIAYIMPGL